MLKSCKYCNRIHDSRFDCGQKPVRKKMRYSQQDYFRRSQAWTDKANEIKRRDHYLCQVCFRKLYHTSRQLTYENLSVHHAIPIKKDWEKRLDNHNLITLCSMHHEMAERGAIPYAEVQRIIEEQEQGSWIP
jgi:5-methylcytosine-specific restriction endonuclease McrA